MLLTDLSNFTTYPGLQIHCCDTHSVLEIREQFLSAHSVPEPVKHNS